MNYLHTIKGKDFNCIVWWILLIHGEGNGNPLQYRAWRIPGTVGPGGLPSMGSHRVGHNWSDLAAAACKHHHNQDKEYPITQNFPGSLNQSIPLLPLAPSNHWFAFYYYRLGFFPPRISMKTYSMCFLCLVFFFQHSDFEVSPCCFIDNPFILLLCGTLLRCSIIYLFTPSWTLEFFQFSPKV